MNDLKYEIVYQLVAKGSYSCFGERGKIHSKEVFRDKLAAEDYKSEFRKIVTTPICEEDLFCLVDNEHLEIKIVELFLVENKKTNEE